MNKSFTTIIILVVQTAIGILNVMGKLTYGYGLGDVFYFAGHIAITVLLVMSALYFIKHQRPIKTINWMLLCLTLINVLQVSILRGTEMPWDGRIFFNF